MVSKAPPETVVASIDAERCAELLTELIRRRSVVGEPTTAHVWLTELLRGMGMRVNHYRVESLPAPFVLASRDVGGSEPGLLFDGHYDTVSATPEDWAHDPWGAEREGDVVYGRGAVDSKGAVAAMLAAIEAILQSGAPLRGPLYYMADSDGERAFRGAVLMEDLGLRSHIGTIFSAEATSNRSIEIAYPGISTWKITVIGRTAHPTESERGVNAVTKAARLVERVAGGGLRLRRGASRWFEPRVTTNAIRTPAGAGWAIPARCDIALSLLTPSGVTLAEVDEDIDVFLRGLEAEEDDVRFEHSVIPMGAGRLWLRPAESDPGHPGVAALAEAVAAVSGRTAAVRQFNGGWVDGAELMRAGSDGFGSPACLTFGPGDFEQAHAVDEHVAVSEVATAARIYAQAALTLLA